METLVMTQQFHEGQEVEVLTGHDCLVAGRGWSKAKIVAIIPDGTQHWDAREGYEVQFTDNSRGVFDAEHIRDVIKPDSDWRAGRTVIRGGDVTHRTSIARLADDAPVPHPDSWPARNPPSVTYDTASAAFRAQAKRTVHSYIKDRAREYALRPRDLDAIAGGLSRLSPKNLIISLWPWPVQPMPMRYFGFGGEVQALNLRGAMLFARYARAKAHQIARRA
jgi:hypothetical protein